MVSGILILPIWIVLCVVAFNIHRKYAWVNPQEMRLCFYIPSLLLVTVMIFLAIYFSAYVIPKTIMDYEWYRTFYRLLMPIFIITSILYWQARFQPLFKCKIILSASLSSLCLFPFLVISLNYLLWFLGVW